MKRQALMILMPLSLFVTLAAASAFAQSDTLLVANIPFGFVIGDKAFPAGEYTLRYTYTNVVRIQSQDGGQNNFFSTGPIQAKGLAGHTGAERMRAELVFNRYGDQYFLSKLWKEGDVSGRAVRMSRSEREIIRARSASAQSAAEPQIVSITLVAGKR